MTRSKEKAKRPAEKINTLFVTWGGTGFSPKMPGTCGTLAAVPVGAAILSFFTPATLAIVALLLALAGIPAIRRYVETRKRDAHDPAEVVIDEVASFLLVMAFIPFTIGALVVALALFRAFDIFKPGIIGMIDRHVTTPAGVMLDDLAAAVLTLFFFHTGFFVLKLFGMI